MIPFYFRSGQKNHGSFEIDQLKDKINPDTIVWSPGMHEWVKAKVEKGSELDDQRESIAVINNPKLNK